MSDIEQINEARSRYNARKTDSSLIEWICSEVWTDVYPLPPWGEGYRGHKETDGRTRDYANMISGEIEIARFPAWCSFALGDIADALNAE